MAQRIDDENVFPTRKREQTGFSTDETYRAFFTASRIVGLLVDPDSGEIIDANPRACLYYGHPHETLLRMNINQINTLPPEEVEREVAAARAEERSAFHFRHRLASGEIRHVDVYSEPVVIEGRTVLHSIVFDVEDRVHAEDHVRRLSAAVEQSPATIVITNLAGNIQYVNPAFTAITGYTREEVLGRNPRILKTGHTPPAHYRLLWDAITSGNVWRGEFLNQRKDGSRFWENATIGPIMDDAGNMTGYVGVEEEISAQKERERKLSEYAEELRTSIDELNAANQEINDRHDQLVALLDGIPEAIYVSDMDTHEVLFVNRHLREMIGDDALGKKCYSALQGKSAPCDFCTNPIIRGTTEPYYWQYHNTTLDRELYVMDRVIRWSNGRDVRFQLAVDITERVLAERALAESEEKYRLLTENAADVIWVLNITQGRFTYISPSVERLRGYTVEEALAEDLDHSLTPESADTVRNAIAERIPRFLETGSPQYSTDEIQQPCKDGSTVWVEVTTRYRAGQNGDVEVVGLSRDITERKQLEAQLLRANEDLTQANATKDKLFSVIAHDLRNPFSQIIGFAQMLKEDMDRIDSTEIGEYTGYIQSAAESANNLLENLLEWSRSQTGRMHFEPRSLAALSEVHAALDVIVPQARAKEVEIHNKIARDATLFADRNMIHTIVRNLVSNALKFSHRGGAVHICGEQTEDGYSLSVVDHGVGMSDDVRARLFGSVGSVQTAGTDSEKGSGLGLVLCREFAERHGGQIDVYSKIGEGSTFTVLFPSGTDG